MRRFLPLVLVPVLLGVAVWLAVAPLPVAGQVGDATIVTSTPVNSETSSENEAYMCRQDDYIDMDTPVTTQSEKTCYRMNVTRTVETRVNMQQVTGSVDVGAAWQSPARSVSYESRRVRYWFWLPRGTTQAALSCQWNHQYEIVASSAQYIGGVATYCYPVFSGWVTGSPATNEFLASPTGLNASWYVSPKPATCGGTVNYSVVWNGDDDGSVKGVWTNNLEWVLETRNDDTLQGADNMVTNWDCSVSWIRDYPWPLPLGSDPTPTPTIFPTWQVTPGGTYTGINPIGINTGTIGINPIISITVPTLSLPTVTPVVVGLDVGSVQRVGCYTLLPGFEFDQWLLQWHVAFSLKEQRVCVSERGVSVRFEEWDFGLLFLVATVGFGGVAIVWGIVKNG